MKIINLARTNALRYTDAVRDRNPIHQTNEEARRMGLNKAIAPGMWLASHIQGRTAITEIKQILFSERVYYGNKIEILESYRRFGGGKDVEFRRGNELVCSVSGIKTKDYSSPPKPLNDRVYVYIADICEERINLFLNSIGSLSLRGNLPEMYIASLCAPALLEYGSRIGISGIHTSLSFKMHSSYSPKKIRLEIGDKRVKGNLNFFELRWEQNGQCVASGRAGVLPFKEILEEKVE